MAHPCCICGNPAMGPYGARSFCSLHKPASPLPLLTVSSAREYLAAGFSLKQAAHQLGVMSSDLDQALWAWIGVADRAPRRYEAVFLA